MKTLAVDNLDRALPVQDADPRPPHPLLLWVGALGFFSSTAWIVVPLAMQMGSSLYNTDAQPVFEGPFIQVILAWVAGCLLVSFIMGAGLLRRTEWAWRGALLTAHGIFVPPLAVLLVLYFLNLVSPPAEVAELRNVVTDYLARLIVPCGLTYLLLLLCLTRSSVKTLLGVHE